MKKIRGCMDIPTEPQEAAATTPDDAWDALDAALQEYMPPCADESAFTADDLSTGERDYCEYVCAHCRVFALCDTYATAAGVESGFWAGRARSPKRNRARWHPLSPASQGDPAVPP